MSKPVILWIVDGVGWGYDNVSKAVERVSPGYEHKRIAKERVRVVCNGTSGFVCEDDQSFQKRIDEIKADIVVSMNPMNKRFLKNKSRSVVRFSGERALNGWHR